jgi:hypothetical protein
MLYFNFTRLFKARGIDKPAGYLVKNGFSDNFATKVVRNSFRRMDLSNIERLCTLLRCTPNDILQWVPDSSDIDIANHPLSPLHQTDKVMDLTRTLHSLPFDKLLEIEKIIQSEIDIIY